MLRDHGHRRRTCRTRRLRRPLVPRDRLGPDVVNFLAWLELSGAAAATLDQYERYLSRASLMYSDRDATTLTDTKLLQVVRSFPPKSRRVRKAAYDSFYRWAVKTDKNPMDLLPQIRRTPQKVIDAFTDIEIEDLMSCP
jgi:hypothetical protein